MDSHSSKNLFARAKNVIPGGVNSPVRAFRGVGGTPFFAQRADGAKLFAVDGQQWIDFVGTWGPAIHGHNHPLIRDAIAEALQKGTSFGVPNPYEVELAERIVKHVPSIEKVRLCNSGTEATMSCIRLSRGFTGRDKIIKFAGCYHGHVDALLVKAGSGALTLGCPDSAGIPQSVAQETIVLPFNNIAALEKVFSEIGETIAAVIVEPYPANCGLILPREGYLAKLRQLCSTFGTVLIFDEVMTGFRIGLSGVQGTENILPDLTALGKIIGGGLPVGAFGGKSAIMDWLAPVGTVYQAGTLSGNPLAMAAGIASLKRLEEQQPYAELERNGAMLAKALQSAAIAKGLPFRITQTGSMFAFFFSDSVVNDYDAVLRCETNFFPKLFHYSLNNGVFLPPSPYETCFISIAHEKRLMEQSAEVLCKGIEIL